jgi:uncharacterized membrane protein
MPSWMRLNEPKIMATHTDTSRLEAFSDGVFAIAITLLVLTIGTPRASPLLPALARQWPQYLAYAVSFLFILVMWINHHTLFRYIERSDHVLLLLNGLLLMLIAFVPFPTNLLAEYLGQGTLPTDQRVAALVFNGTYGVLAIAFNLLWRYASHNGRLLDSRVHSRHIVEITRDYRWGPALYFAAFILAFFNVWASLAVNVGLAMFFALPRSRTRLLLGSRLVDLPDRSVP